MKISVVLPVYNEKENLRPLQKEITEAMEENYKDWEVIYVDDGSSDGSPSVLEEIAEKNQEVKVIKFRKNFGQSSALQAGFDHASGEVVVAMDSDGQN
ncbi:MAG: glycosyltransferase, partial [Candidatus Aenigmatarchaeota archaeon]